jgi:transcriptional regulator with XRE-family HTH domain
MVEENLPQVLRCFRESRHVTLRGLAEQTGFSPSFLSQVENGQASPHSLHFWRQLKPTLSLSSASAFQAAAPRAGSEN